MNRVTLFGRVGRDPELKRTQSGTAVCSFSVATSERWKDRGGESQERTEWHNVVVWEKQAEHCATYVRKGSQVLIEGKIQSRKYKAKDGEERTAFEIVASHVTFVGSKPEGEPRASSGGLHASPQGAGKSWGDDEIPF